MGERLELTGEEARELLWSHDEYRIIQDVIVSTSRWAIDHDIVIQRISDGKYFMDSYSVGATEGQEQRPWDEYGYPPNFVEVVPVEKTIIVYMEEKNIGL
jgi:hypothetical protein